MLRIKRVHTEALREEVYALRYRAYRRENAIAESSDERFEDEYDAQPNHVLWALTDDEKVIGSIRATWYEHNKHHFSIPEIQSYYEEITKFIPHNAVIVSANRFVTESDKTVPYFQRITLFLLRHYMLAAQYKNADWGIVAVRKNHLSFYNRKFYLEKISEAKSYPNLNCPMYLMGCDFKKNANTVYKNSPILKPKEYERVFFDENYRDIWEIGLPVEL